MIPVIKAVELTIEDLNDAERDMYYNIFVPVLTADEPTLADS